jgi:nucleotide-binding universal stress UspA family protein
MAIKVILVPMNASAACEAALATAFALARQLHAHVSALHVRADPRHSMPYMGEGMSGVVIQELMAAVESEAAERAAKARALFDRVCEAEAVPVVEAASSPGRPSVSWIEETGREDETVAHCARLADVVVIADRPAEPDAPPMGLTMEAALLVSGRPVLIVPPGGAKALGARVAVAWNGSVEASRAVAAAMPLLEGAEEVAVLALGEGDEPRVAAERLVRYLAWHDIRACEHVLRPGPDGTGAVLLAEADRIASDLLVMGAYTHNRFREMIFGGVTRHVLAHAGLPVLVAH